MVASSALITPPSKEEQSEDLSSAILLSSIEEGIITEKRTTNSQHSITSNLPIIYHFLDFLGLIFLSSLCTKLIQRFRKIYFKVYASLPIQLRLFGFSYHITNNITSSATRVMFTDKGGSKAEVCFKMWRDCDNELYYTKDIKRCARYLLEGWKFNRCFAKDVYIGIACVKSLSETHINCGRLLWFPTWHTTKIEQSNQAYVLVMRHLGQHLRLDHQLLNDDMRTKEAMSFLAHAIAQMHSKLEPSYDESGTHQRILTKLELNKRQFNAALDALSSPEQSIPFDKDKYKHINVIITYAYKRYISYFKQRYNNGNIRRCHGDLKATNLWVCQNKSGKRELLALDCVDFKPEFCHIDTLSDVAMLAIDLEMRLTYHADESGDRRTGKKLANHFLYTYLNVMHAKGSDVEFLLEYYMTEKAMICAFMSILYDQLPTLGIRYLDVALVHARRLKKKLALR